MTTTTVRLDAEEQALLDLLAPTYGGRSGVLRHALRTLAADRQREEALHGFLDDWAAQDGAVDEAAVTEMADRYGL